MATVTLKGIKKIYENEVNRIVYKVKTGQIVTAQCRTHYRR